MEESPTMEEMGSQMPKILPPCSSGRRSSDSNSPEFEFWKLNYPSNPEANLLSADELFVDGVLLPLQLLHLHQHADDPPDNLHPLQPDSETGESETTNRNGGIPLDPEPESEPEIAPGPELAFALPDPSAAVLSGSKRWKDIFKKSEKKEGKEKEKGKKKERKTSGGGASSAELNINIWPFARSRSAGNGGNRPRVAAGQAATRKVSSAPCSRSNSAGESKSRKWPGSPSRGGVHLGRASPVWQVRRGKSSEPLAARNAEKGVQKEGNETRRKKSAAAASVAGGGAKARVLNLNVPMCVGYRQHLSCRSDESGAVSVAAVGGGGSVGQNGGSVSGDGGRGGNLFNLRNLFTKKVY